jgi:hypothetical protein
VPVNVFSGIAFDVDRVSGLCGDCDYLIARSDKIYYVEAPVVAVVEAKKEDIIGGLGQCAAELVAIRLFNDREKSTIPIVYGCVTSGTNWWFLKLEASTLTIIIFKNFPSCWVSSSPSCGDDRFEKDQIFVDQANSTRSELSSSRGESRPPSGGRSSRG